MKRLPNVHVETYYVTIKELLTALGIDGTDASNVELEISGNIGDRLLKVTRQEGLDKLRAEQTARLSK